MKLPSRFLALFVLICASTSAFADKITSATLRIQGAGLELITDPPLVLGVDIPGTIQTEFGGESNDKAPNAGDGVVAVGELSGPGLETPLQLTTAPGHKFQIPGLPKIGTYYLQNVRLMNGTQFLQYATPAAATITVADLLQTKVTVRQLTAADLRARGITIDARNFDVYEYSFTFIIDGKEVIIPFPVIVDPRTREIQPVAREHEYAIPPTKLVEPPRWSPPQIIPLAFEEEPFPQEDGPKEAERKKQGKPFSIPAAIVIPNSLSVLHQFFAVALMVTNGAPAGSATELHDIRATIKIPTALRTVKTEPQVSFGQAVPIVEPETGVTFLIAQARGEAEWTLEGLKSGTHRIDFDLRAVLKQPGQVDLPMRATPSAAVVVHDARFNINFSHPDTVREGIDYSTYMFITNMSGTDQQITVNSGIARCAGGLPDDDDEGPNVCRLNGEMTDLITIPADDMRMVEYRLRPGVTGKVFATAGSVDNPDNITAAVRLHMGVGDNGIPLSPATLVMPHYAQYVSSTVVASNLQLFGLGYSLATAPLNQMTAKFPRVIRSDVFQRAVDVSRAGQRIFITDDNATSKRDAIANMVLDLLGNGGHELQEWDELRRTVKSGRIAGNANMRELEQTAFVDGATMSTVFDNFARATAHRAPYLAALAYGSGSGDNPYAVSLTGVATNRATSLANEIQGEWRRDLPWSDVSSISGGGAKGELAMMGRWAEDVDVTVTPAVDGPFTLELLYPATEDGRLLHARFSLTGSAGQALTVRIARGAGSLSVRDAADAVVTNADASTIGPAPLRIEGARQDMHLDRDGHKVSVLFSRPVVTPEGVDLRTKFTGAIDFNKSNVVYKGPRPISAAALQEDGRTVNLTFDHTLSTNATYTIETGSLTDPTNGSAASFAGKTVPKIDNDEPAGIVYGHVVKGDNSPVQGADVILRQFLPGQTDDEPKGAPQYDVSQADGAFLYEFVRRDINLDWSGQYKLEAVSTVHKTTSVIGSVRLPREVHFVTLQYLGRGAAEGFVRYDDGSAVANADVVIGSTMFNQFRSTKSDSEGFYHVDDLPVGPLTFSAKDRDGNITFAASEVAVPGQLVTQNLSIYRKPFPGVGRVYGVVRRSDKMNEGVAGVHVGVYSQGYGLIDGYTDANGNFEFEKVPAGFITILAEEWSTARQSVALDVDLKPNENRYGELIFIMQPDRKFAKMTGQVTRENPLKPGVIEKVPGAIVKISGYLTTTADADGKFTYEDLPVELTKNAREIAAYDPITKRVKSVDMPTLTDQGTHHVAIHINAFDRGTGTVRVRLLDAAGAPVPGYRVIIPAFPDPFVFREVAGQIGVYDLPNAQLGEYEVWAVAGGARPPSGETDTRKYGDQVTNGEVNVLFNGHIAPLTLRLPGQGTVRVSVKGAFPLIAPVDLTYSIWFEAEQMMVPLTISESSQKNGEADFAIFKNIPALQGYGVGTDHPAHGSAGQGGQLAFDNDINTHELQLSTLTTIRGTVYAIDGQTPIAGAQVKIDNGRFDAGWQLTGPDGRFEFRDQPSGFSVRVLAQVTQAGVFRTGFTSVTTPVKGGFLENVGVILRQRGFVEGRVVYKDYKKYDPANPANNIPDDTPGQYSDNAPVPLASFWLRELDFPQREFGNNQDPLTTDVGGRFYLPSVFVGALRANAWDSENQELRGSWTGSIEQEGAEALPKAYIAVGDGGVGSATVTVYDPNDGVRTPVPNADVSIFVSGQRPFDFSTTGLMGSATFAELPVGTYTVSAYSKSVGKTTKTVTLTITRDRNTNVELELEFKGKVEGTLVDLEGGDRSVVPGAHVRLAASNYSTQSTTSKEGFFVFDGVREGEFDVTAKDTDTNRRAHEKRTIDAADPYHNIELVLEPIETLHFRAYLPDDTGKQSTEYAPPVRAEVRQGCWKDLQGTLHCDYRREAQGNPLVFEGVLENRGYSIEIWEPGDMEPSLHLYGEFPYGSASNPHVYTYPAFGDVHVTVKQGGQPVSGARVRITSEGKGVWAYTDGTGVAIARQMPLSQGKNLVSIQASSPDNKFTGVASVKLERTSVPAVAEIVLGQYAGITGEVQAETGGPSIGTRVIAWLGSHVAEARTDGAGRYTFLGIQTPATGTQPVTLKYIGADDQTPGGEQTVRVAATDGVKDVGRFTIDATIPKLVSILPENGALAVSPDASVIVTFSEAIDPDSITEQNFQLVAADGQVVEATRHGTELARDRYTVEIKPNTPATGLPLRSNTLYRVIVDDGIRDMTGHLLGVTVGSLFTTTDYAEPRVQKALPASPIPSTTAFEFRFNEPIDPRPWEQGGAGRFHVYKLIAPGGENAAIDNTWCGDAPKPCELKANAFVPPPHHMSLFITPADANPIIAESYYRVVFSGVKDPQGNQLEEQTYHFYSFDEVKPFLIFSTPPQSEQLITGAEYEIKPEFRNGSATGSVATDVVKVEYFTFAADGKEVPFATITKAPFSVKVLAPETTAGANATFKLGAQPYDGSGNQGPKSTATWTVIPNSAPKNVVITPSAAGAYPSKAISAGVVFEDEGTFATVSLSFRTPRAGGLEDSKSFSTILRREVGGVWPPATFSYTLPQDAVAGAAVTITAIVSDSRNSAPPATATVEVTPDTIPPVFNTVLPAPNQTYFNAQKFVIEANVSDAETGVQSITFNVDGRMYATATTTNHANGSKTFKSVEIEARSKAEDAYIPVVLVAKDFHNNPRTKAFELFYKGVTDPEAPKVSWLCPVDGAVLPASVQNYTLPLRVTAVDQDLRDVSFRIGEQTYPAGRVGTTNEYTASVSFATTPQPGTLEVVAVVKDEFDTHTVNLPITLDVIAADFTFVSTKAVLAADAATYKDKTILLDGPNARLVPQVPLQLRNLIVVNGAKVETLPTDTIREFKLAITTTGTTYVDCDSSMDVSAKGYMGGWQTIENQQNKDSRGRIVGNTAEGGATDGAQPSHGGLGGIWIASGVTNTPYGSIWSPVDLGAGGPGPATPNTQYSGRAGGGAITLRGADGIDDLSRIVIAGQLLANGDSGLGNTVTSGGTGGSIWIDAKQIVLGPRAVIAAHGGDDGPVGSPNALGAGGGRIALTASEKMELQNAQIAAHGGRFIGPSDNDATATDGGSGTIYFRRPGQVAGELLVTGYDSRFPNTRHPVRPTPIGRIGTGTSTAVTANSLTDATRKFDRWMIGQKLVLAGNTARSFAIVDVSTDGRTLHTSTEDGSMLDVATTQQVAYAGLIAFDKITAEKRAVIVFDDHVESQGVLNDREAMTIDATAAVVLRYDEPKVTITSTPADGGSVIRETTVSITYSITASGGVARVKLLWSADAVERIHEFHDFPNKAEKTFTLPVPASAPGTEATLRFLITDRAGRSFEVPARTFVITENAVPVITSYTIIPASLTIHAGHDVVANVQATDDIAVKNVTFQAVLNGTVIKTASIPTGVVSSNNNFTVSLPNDDAGGSLLVINASVSDAYPGRTPTTASQTITILNDTVAPSINVTLPAEGQSYRELADKIVVRAIVTDADVAVKEVSMQFDGGAPVVMNRVNQSNEFTGEMTAPVVDGDQPVPHTITVTAKDYAGNTATSPAVNIQVRPVVDANAAVLSWACSSPGALYIPGYTAKIRINAVPASVPDQPNGNPVQSVTMMLDDTTPLTVTTLPNNQYEATFTIPADAVEGTTYRVRATARAAGEAVSDLVTTFSVVIPTVAPIAASTTIGTGTTTYDNQTVVITGGTVTIVGNHTFDRLIVLGGSVVANARETLNITSTRTTYVACGAFVDMDAKGYSKNSSYPGAVLPGDGTGGSHIGRGGHHTGSAGATYGSVYRPQELGSGSGSDYNAPSSGGGAVRVRTGTLVVDGTVRANGQTGDSRAGAGGSVWITTGRIGGGGFIQANGANAGHGSGGGGAVAIEYSDPASTVPSLSAKTGHSGESKFGGAGSIYLFGPQAVYGDLVIDHTGVSNYQTTNLPSLGGGKAQAGTTGATVATDRTTDIPAYFKGHWVEIRDAAGVLKGTWRISDVAARNFVLEGAGVSVAPGDQWQGVYRFDNVRMTRTNIAPGDPIRVVGNFVVDGLVEIDEITAGNLRVTKSGSLRHLLRRRLSVRVENEVRIDQGGVIDLDGRGYAKNETLPGETAPGDGSGGSHIGRGGLHTGSMGSTYGSIYRPTELGSGAGSDYGAASSGGGAVRIEAKNVVIDGVVRANGQTGDSRAGAGGSVWITTDRISGIGTIQVNGANAGHGSAGGGAIAIEYTDAASTLPKREAYAGTTGENKTGGPGSIYTFGPDATYGELLVDSNTRGGTVVLPALGSGTALAGSGGTKLVTGRTIRTFFAGHWVEVRDANGSLKGTWRIASINGQEITFEAGAGVATGDLFQGVYRFDDATFRGVTILSNDPIRVAGAQTLSGTIETSNITTHDLRLLTGAKLTHAQLGSLTIDLTGELVIETDAAIDVSGRGYLKNKSWPGATLPGDGSGGSHIGRGGVHSAPQGTTFGSVYRPAEHGGGAGSDYGAASSGGGVVRISADRVVVLGAIRANGITGDSRAGAGGSIWISTGRISGTGTIQANGGNAGHGSAGGGAIAVEYTDDESELPPMEAFAGTAGEPKPGGPGSIYTFGPHSTYGTLRVDAGTRAVGPVHFPSLGSGVAQAGTGGTTVYTGTTPIPAYFVGHWVEISSATGALRGTWRIESVEGAAFTLAPGANVQEGDRWQGVYRFDDALLRGITFVSDDPLRVEMTRFESTVVTDRVTSHDVVVANGATLRHQDLASLSISLTGELRVEQNATIDLNGRGYRRNTSYPGARVPGDGSGGSHIGRGGRHSGPQGATYGSVYVPKELGAAGGTDYNGPTNGGGLLTVDAESVVVDGLIRANGITGDSRAGAGGSILIRTNRFRGVGTIEANGAAGGHGAGGGGAIAVWYATESASMPARLARGGRSNENKHGGPGSILMHGPSSTYGALTLDNGTTAGEPAVLPPLGRGVVVSVSGRTIETDAIAAFPAYAVGNWIDIYPPSGSRKGTWRIAAIDGRTLTLEDNGASTVSVAPGDLWRGVHVFDSITQNNAPIVVIDDIRPTPTGPITANDPPVFDASRLGEIVLQSMPEADVVVLPSNMITDANAPITLLVQNTRTKQTFTGTASGGFFRITVAGEVGDTFTVRATDGYSTPATSRAVPVNGAIADVNGVAAVSLQPSSVVGGERVTGIIRMQYPVRRPTAGVVTISSSHASADVPATVNVPVGATSAPFDVTTSSVASTTQATITASSGNGSQSAALTLLGGNSTLSSITLDAATVDGGTSLNATLTLGAPAPEGGAAVMVSSSDTRLATVPELVVVPEGATSTSFTVTTHRVPASAQVTITAVWGSAASASATISECDQLLTVPAPAVSVDQVWIDDTLPDGATKQSVMAAFDATQVAAGTAALHFAGTAPGIRWFSITGATTTLTVGPNDLLVAYALVNPCDPPKQILLEWKDTAATPKTYRASWGESRYDPTTTHFMVGALPQGSEWVRLGVRAGDLGITANTTLNSFTARVTDGEVWLDAIGKSACSIGLAAPPAVSPHELVWFDDELPAGASLTGISYSGGTAWAWDTTQYATGTRSHVSGLRTQRNVHYFHKATDKMIPGQGDVLFTYVFLDPCNPPDEVMLGWHVNGDEEHRAYWGDDLFTNVGSNGAPSRYRVGPLPELGKWVRLEVPAALVDLEGSSIDGMTFVLVNGKYPNTTVDEPSRGWFDRSGRIPRVNVALGKSAEQSSSPSSPASTDEASTAVDGDLTAWSLTASESQPYWQVDLGASFPIDMIEFHNRNDKEVETQRLANFWILVSDQPITGRTLAQARATTGVSAMRYYSSELRDIVRVNRTGRYVRIQLEGTNTLSLREVQVWAHGAASRVNLAIGKTASHSRDFDQFTIAPHLVDGGTTRWFHHTSHAARSWAQVDLGRSEYISSIDIHKRLNCCPERLANFYVFVTDDASLFTNNDPAVLMATAGVQAWYFATIPVMKNVPIEARGRYVRIQLAGTNYLHLSELQVWGQQPTLLPMSRKPADTQ